MAEGHLPEREATSIVLRGSFNPAIFAPAWFVRHGLLPQGDEETANVTMIDNDVCIFETEMFHLEVLGDRFVLGSLAAPAPEALRDLVVGTMTILKHTPIQMVAINTHNHYRLRDEEQWHRFGHRVVPKDDLWTPVLMNPGTRSVSVQAERADDTFSGGVVVKVEPSMRIEHGLFVETNDEYRSSDSTDAILAVTVLSEFWDDSLTRARAVHDHLLKMATGSDDAS